MEKLATYVDGGHHARHHVLASEHTTVDFKHRMSGEAGQLAETLVAGTKGQA